MEQKSIYFSHHNENTELPMYSQHKPTLIESGAVDVSRFQQEITLRKYCEHNVNDDNYYNPLKTLLEQRKSFANELRQIENHEYNSKSAQTIREMIDYINDLIRQYLGL